MARYVRNRSSVPAALLIAAGSLVGCDQERAPSRHSYGVFAGRVIACHTDTGELTVRGSRRTANGPTDTTMYCLITRDTEIYINDKVSSIKEIQIGDAVELVGRRDPNPQLERFVVSFAYLDHPLPPPPRPILTPASAPGQQDATGQPDTLEE